MKLLDRYVLRNFIEPFLMCFFGFIGIWLLFDLTGNLNEFTSAHASVKTIAFYYLTQVPQIVILSLPVGLLLAMLFSLSAMSRRNEIISMLTAGRSVTRVLLPLFGVGLLTSGLCLWLNWEMAPHAEGIRKTAMKLMKENAKKGRKAGDTKAGERAVIFGHLFRDRQNDRTWYVRKLKPGSDQLSTVHITQQNAAGDITRKYYADRAGYDPATKTWTLERGMIVDFTASGDIGETDYFFDGERTMTGWTETPWRIASSQLDAGNLSVPELQSYLQYNDDFPETQLAPYRTNLADRIAWPMTCFLVVLMAAPLGIVFNRRGVLGGVATALVLFVCLLLSRYLFLAFGKGDRIAPLLAPWLPDIAAFVIGLLLLWFRSTSRELPRFSFKRP